MLFGMLDPRFALKKLGCVFVLALSLKQGFGLWGSSAWSGVRWESPAGPGAAAAAAPK